MPEKTTRQHGLWESPITPRSLAEDRRLEAARWDSDGRTLVWLEGRSGRGVLLAQSEGDDAPRELTSDLSVRAEVGYGGGDFTVGNGAVYFAVHKTGRIYRQPLSGGSAAPITPAFGSAASPTLSPDGRWLAYVHHDEEQNDRIALVDAQGKQWPQIFTSGHDFYMQPRWSSCGKRFAWIAWDHPNMPWDGTLLYVADVIQDGQSPPRLSEPRVVAGDGETAIFQPEFTPDGKSLLYVSDAAGWGRIALQDLSSGERRWLTPEETEYALPAWAQDMRTYAVGHDGSYLIAVGNKLAFQQASRIEIESGQTTPIEPLATYSEIMQIAASPTEERVALVGSGPTQPPRVVTCDFAAKDVRTVARASGETISPEALATCESVSWKSAGDETAHGLYYAPASDRYTGSDKPPLIVLVHGGPTSQVRAGWKAEAQFFATRGYAVLFVNYRGGTGYGREYMLRLRGNWGVCDIEDSISGAKFLADAGKADPRRTVIMGGSAGGFTVLQTMADHPTAFAAGICLYGVADQFHLAAETHKFESRYLDTILGPLPEASETYRRRSPVYRADKIERPLAVFQGGIDRVVPQAQSDMIIEALNRNGTPNVYHVYDDEGHGWRKRETIEHFYEAVDSFLRRYVIYT